MATTTVTAEGKWSLTSHQLELGEHTIRAKAVDDSSNTSPFSKAVHFTVKEHLGPVPAAPANQTEIKFKSESNQEDTENLEFFKESIRDIALILLSPVLAIAIWFVLFQGGTTADYTLAAIGITTGLLIKEIVTRLISFASPKVTAQSKLFFNSNALYSSDSIQI